MYNDKNQTCSQGLNRDIPPRVPIGRSCPAFAKSDATPSSPTKIGEMQIRRLCDGSLPEDAPFGESRMNQRQEGGNCHGGCGETDGGWGLSSYPLAMVYAPLQQFRELYEPDVALERGTMFRELDLPFEGDKTHKGGCKL